MSSQKEQEGSSSEDKRKKMHAKPQGCPKGKSQEVNVEKDRKIQKNREARSPQEFDRNEGQGREQF